MSSGIGWCSVHKCWMKEIKLPKIKKKPREVEYVCLQCVTDVPKLNRKQRRMMG